MKLLGIFALITTLFSACSTQVQDAADQQRSRTAVEVQQACDKGECPCSTPVGTIDHGSSINTYPESEVACDRNCGDIVELVTCNNGELFDANNEKQEMDGLQFRCKVLECPSCRLGNNIIPHGGSVETFSANEVGCSESCEDINQIRLCNMGELSGEDSFNKLNCQRKNCRCELPDNTGWVAYNNKVTYFNTQQAQCGETCLRDHSLEMTCTSLDSEETFDLAIESPADSGQFTTTGTDDFIYRSCNEPQNCFCTLPNGLGVVSHDNTEVVSKTDQVTCGNTCKASDEVNVICKNGIFKLFSDQAVTVDFSSANYSAFRHFCNVEDCVRCDVPGKGFSIGHDENYRFYKQSSVPCRGTCNSRLRRCINGAFDGDATFDKADCEIRSCYCDVPNEDGLQVEIGGDWPFFSNPTPACGSSCAQVSELKVCTEISDNGSYSNVFVGSETFLATSCQEPTGCRCALPNGLGEITDKKSVILTSQATVQCGELCSSVPSIEVYCDNGVLVNAADSSIVNTADPNFAYIYRCKQSSCQACSIGSFTIPNDQDMTLYSKAVLTCQDDINLLTFKFKCENGALLRNGNPYDPEADPSAPADWYSSYDLDCPGCELPWGGKIPEGDSVIAYKKFGSGTTESDCGFGCKSSERKCENGVLQGEEDFNLDKCPNLCDEEGGGAPPRVCLLRWQNSWVTPGAEVMMYKKKTVPCGESCQDQGVLAKCDMATGEFLNAPFEYQYQSCSELCAP